MFAGSQLPCNIQPTQIREGVAVNHDNFPCGQINCFHSHRLIDLLHLPHGWVERPVREDNAIAAKAQAAGFITEITTVGVPRCSDFTYLPSPLIHPIPNKTTAHTSM